MLIRLFSIGLQYIQYKLVISHQVKGQVKSMPTLILKSGHLIYMVNQLKIQSS